MKKILLIGDSLTQRGFDGSAGWTSLLANEYIRRCDIVNRGMSGYNSEWVRHILPHILNDMALFKEDKMLFICVFLGANDAVLDGERQHVPIDRYLENMKWIIEEIKRKFPQVPVILISPPPCLVEDWREHRRQQNRKCDRTEEQTANYARGLVELARELHLPVVNLIQQFQNISNEDLNTYFCDGLHFTAKGNRFLFDALIDVLKTELPECLPQSLPFYFPTHDQVDIDNLETSLQP